MRSFLRKLGWMFSRRRKEDELAEELRFHLEEEAAELESRGVATGGEAVRLASRDLGNIPLVAEAVRDSWGWTALEQLLQDIRFGVRSLAKSPWFTWVAVLTLATSIGINSAVFTIVSGMLFRGFPLVAENGRLVYITTGVGCCVSYPDFADWKAQAKSFSGMAIVRGQRRNVTGGNGYAEMYTVTEISPETFAIAGQKPLLGRDFRTEDAVPGAALTAILTYDLWEQRFAKDPAIVGKPVRMNGVQTTLIGVMPKGFLFPQKQAMWVPLIPDSGLLNRENRGTWFVFGRLATGATLQSARLEMETIGRRLGSFYPVTNQGRNLIPQVETFNGFFVGQSESTVYWSMWGAVCLVLLIACSNLANLMLARALGRGREISIRIALGAGRWRIARQLLIESTLLSVAGAMPGWFLAVWSIHVWTHLERGPGGWSWRIIDYAVDGHVRAYITGITVVTALLFGLAPALRLLKESVSAGLKDGGKATSGGRRGRLPGLLVASQMALALVLLTAAGVMTRSFLNVYNARLGVTTKNLLVLYADLPQARYSTPARRIVFFERTRTEMIATSGVVSVALATEVPTDRTSQFGFEVAGVKTLEEKLRPKVGGIVVSDGYFQTLGALMVAGREFREADGERSAPVAIINQEFAKRQWPGENPLGKQLRLFDGKKPDAWRTVVGIASHVAQNGVPVAGRQEFTPLVYVPFRQKPSDSMRVMARIAPLQSTMAQVTKTLREKMQKLDPDLPVVGPQPLDEILESGYWNRELYGMLFLLFAGIALLLASVGLYAVITHSVNRRVQEIGVRMAVGASRWDIVRLVVREGLTPVAFGLAAGLAGSAAVIPMLGSVLVQVSPVDPLTFTGASVVLLAAALLGCLVPAQRATQVDPLVALRHE